MGLGNSLPLSPFDYPEVVEREGPTECKYISYSTMYCLVQQHAEWPNYYYIIDCRTAKQYAKSHIIGAKHMADFNETKANDVTVILYAAKETSDVINTMLAAFDEGKASPSCLYIMKGKYSVFSKRYRVVISSFTQTREELPGPVELVAATKKTPAIYVSHRKQFHYCKTTIAYLGCNAILNISSRRLYLKHGSIQLENVQFDGVNEPYDEAVDILDRFTSKKPKSSKIDNILIINETGSNYAALLVGWWWYKKDCDIEQIAELLQIKNADLDSWYIDVLRAWVDAEVENNNVEE